MCPPPSFVLLPGRTEFRADKKTACFSSGSWKEEQKLACQCFWQNDTGFRLPEESESLSVKSLSITHIMLSVPRSWATPLFHNTLNGEVLRLDRNCWYFLVSVVLLILFLIYYSGHVPWHSGVLSYSYADMLYMHSCTVNTSNECPTIAVLIPAAVWETSIWTSVYFSIVYSALFNSSQNVLLPQGAVL